VVIEPDRRTAQPVFAEGLNKCTCLWSLTELIQMSLVSLAMQRVNFDPTLRDTVAFEHKIDQGCHIDTRVERACIAPAISRRP